MPQQRRFRERLAHRPRQAVSGTCRCRDGEPACPALTQDPLERAEHGLPVVVGPLPEPHVEVVDEQNARDRGG
jgi:hypothetical protein